MAVYADRLGDLLNGVKRRRRVLITPEGLPLDIQIASRGERLAAFCLDVLFLFLTVTALYLLLALLFFTRVSAPLATTFLLFIAFLTRNLYFIHFELAWQGRTPGKRVCGLRVISRDGGELTPSAVIARNLTREVEFFLPLSLLAATVFSGDRQIWLVLGWVSAISLLPLFNREHLRAGDLIAGTMVIAMPKRVLLHDLTRTPEWEQLQARAQSREQTTGRMPAPSGRTKDRMGPAYAFTPQQLELYGAFELQVLEELLRRPPSPDADALLAEVCGKIRAKTGWLDPVPPGETRRFLTAFYTAERADLERGQLFGQLREDKSGKKQG